MKTFVRKYYRCLTCNLTFKNKNSAIEHKVKTSHKIITEYFPSKFEPFPSIKIEKKPNQEFKSHYEEPYELTINSKNDKYVCLTCGLRFNNFPNAEEHKINTLHKLGQGNLSPNFWSKYKTLEEIIGSNIDYDAFCQRALHEVPNEDEF